MPGVRFAAALRHALLLVSLCAASATQAAESYDNCIGFIESLPAVVSTQGTWCLRRDLATAITTGPAVNVTTNNVTLDCNGYKLGGLAGGAASQAVGIRAVGPGNVTVRHCSVRGFQEAILVAGPGAVIEDNRVEGALFVGIDVDGAGGMIRRNRVQTTGGSAGGASPTAIRSTDGVDVIDNSVDGVDSGSASAISVGIDVLADSDVSVDGNRIRNVASTGGFPSYAIAVNSFSTGSVSLRGNTLGNSGGGNAVGIRCHGLVDIASDNHLVGFSSSLSAQGCTVGPGNVER